MMIDCSAEQHLHHVEWLTATYVVLCTTQDSDMALPESNCSTAVLVFLNEIFKNFFW